VNTLTKFQTRNIALNWTNTYVNLNSVVRCRQVPNLFNLKLVSASSQQPKSYRVTPRRPFLSKRHSSMFVSMKK
jgi:hypothetical protein